LDEWMFGWMDGCKVEWLGVWMVNNTSGVWTHNLFWREVPKGSRQGLDRSPSHQPWCIHSFVEQFSALIYLILEFFWVFWCNWGSYLTESYTLSKAEGRNVVLFVLFVCFVVLRLSPQKPYGHGLYSWCSWKVIQVGCTKVVSLCWDQCFISPSFFLLILG
jgi:hypothetical protein